MTHETGGRRGGDDESGLAQLLGRMGAVRFSRAADSTLRFLEIDGPCGERVGLSRATLTGDAYSFWSRVDARDRRRVLGVLEEAIRKGASYRVVYRVEAGDGVARCVREEGAARLAADGEVELLEGILLDGAVDPAAAHGEGAVDDLAERCERFHELAQRSGMMIAEISEGPRVSFVSAELSARLGAAADALTGRDPMSLLHPEDRDHVLASVRDVLSSGGIGGALCRLERADGSWMWAEMNGTVYTGSSGARRGVVGIRGVENHVRVEEAFLAQRVVEARIGKLCRRFIELGSEGLDEAIEEAIEAAAEIGGADRCYLAVFSSDRATRARLWRWQRPELGDWELSLDRATAERHAWMAEKLARGEMVAVPRIAELPDELSAAREDLLGRGIRSYCVIPVRVEGTITALLGFQVLREERDWSHQQLALLRLVAELLSSALRRRDVENALRDGEERLRALADSAQDGVCENQLTGGEILYANPRFYAMHGYTEEEARGMGSLDFMHPEDLDRIRETYAAFERGDLGESVQGTLLYRALHKDGRTLWMEANGRLFRTASGHLRSAAVIRDVTDRQQAQRVMERRLENQRRIANVARDLLALGLEEMDAGIDEALVSLLPISGADRAWLLLYDPVTREPEAWEWRAEGVPEPGFPIAEVDLDRQRETVARFEAGRETVLSARPDLPSESPERRFLEARGATAMLVIPLHSGRRLVGGVGFELVDGEPAWDDEAIALLRLGGEVFVSAVSRKRAEHALRESRGQLLQAQKMEAVGTLAGGVAHDFNNQLSVILGNARFVIGEVGGDPDLREAMTDLERAADYCAQLTRQLLSFSRHVPAEPRPISVSKVLRDVAELTAPLLSQGICFEAVPHDEFAEVWADRTQLQQVLVNLVVNARDAMPDGGNLSIRTEPRRLGDAEARRLGVAVGEYVQFVVADTGFGMDPATLNRIFEPFFTTKEQGKGTGLGLATVYGILTESGGAIWADSSPGVGTTFRMLLPRAPEAEETAPRGLEGGETLLLVEDEKSVRRLMRRMIGRIGFHVLEAENAEEAMRVSAAHPGTIDVLVSDVSMPDMGGVELGRRLLETRPTLRVLLVTGHAQDDVALPGARILCKPFRQEELEWALESLLRG